MGTDPGNTLAYILDPPISLTTRWICTGPDQQHPHVKDSKTSPAFILEASCIAIFTVEFLVRLFSTPNLRDFWTSFYTWVDVLAIAPFYVGVCVAGNAGEFLVVLRVLRLLRLLRMLKLGRQFEAVQVLIIALNRTLSPLIVAMLGINSIAVILFASLLFVAEQTEADFDEDSLQWKRLNSSQYPDAGEVIQFQSIPDSMWWAWVTLTTVGYGDAYRAGQLNVAGLPAKPNQTKPPINQTKPNQTSYKPNQTKPPINQTKPNQTSYKPNQTKPNLL